MPSLPQPYSVTKKLVCPKVRKIGSNRAVLVNVWTFLVYLSHSTLVGHHLPGNSAALAECIGYGIVALVGPVAGLISSAYYGRFKLVYASFWFMWIGIISMLILLIALGLLPDTHSNWQYFGLVLGEVLYFIGLTLFAVISIPFGLDQMPDASGEQISAFIHWYVWCMLAGLATGSILPGALFDCLHYSSQPHGHIIELFVSTIFVTIALCSIFLLSGWLIIEPKGTNPLKKIIKVLKFAAKHKIPVRRSAFTYWEGEKPSRIDLAKSKYGGPFSTEEVEDVKTCLRMLVVIVSIIIILTSFSAYSSSIPTALYVMFNNARYSDCWNHTIKVIIGIILFAVFSLPVYEVIVHPFVRKCIPNTLKRAGLAQTLTVCASVTLLVISTVWYTSSPPNHCMFTSNNTSTYLSMDNIIHRAAFPFFLLINWSFLFFLLTAMLEFVCAQAPYSLRGLLVGSVHSVVLMSIALGLLIIGIWKAGYHRNASSSSCGVWFYLFTTISTTLGCVMWCAVAKWYKKRERGEPEMVRIFAENYYSQ